jgi:hypothetical protein
MELEKNKKGVVFTKTSEQVNAYPFHIPKVPSQHLYHLK